MVFERCRRFLGKAFLMALAAVLVAGMLPAGSVQAQESGDYANGLKYFTGQKKFENGGPACISCHSVSFGALGGGNLGPDLTKAYADPSKNPFINAAWINNAGSPTMGPIFRDRPVTDDEVASLRAFFERQSQGPMKAAPTGLFTIIGLGGFIGILIVFNIIWSGRYRNRCRGTAHDAIWRNYGGKGGR